MIARSLHTAARHGLAGPGWDVTTGSPAPAEKRGCRAIESRGGGALRAASETPAVFAARLAAVTRGTDDERLEAAQ